MNAIYHGKDGFTRFWNTFREPWESIRVEEERIEDLGERVLALFMFHGKGKGSGVDVSAEYANVFTLRDGLITYQVRIRRLEVCSRSRRVVQSRF
jgi:ketosteroid isomerase-like protein